MHTVRKISIGTNIVRPSFQIKKKKIILIFQKIFKPLILFQKQQLKFRRRRPAGP